MLELHQYHSRIDQSRFDLHPQSTKTNTYLVFELLFSAIGILLQFSEFLLAHAHHFASSSAQRLKATLAIQSDM